MIQLTHEQFQNVERYGTKLVHVDTPYSNTRRLIYEYKRKLYIFAKVNGEYCHYINTGMLNYCEVTVKSKVKGLQQCLNDSTNQVIHKYYYI